MYLSSEIFAEDESLLLRMNLRCYPQREREKEKEREREKEKERERERAREREREREGKYRGEIYT